MKLWHLLVIGGVAYLAFRKKTPTVVAPVATTPVPGAYDTQAIQEAAAAAAAAAGASVPGIPGAVPVAGIGWMRV